MQGKKSNNTDQEGLFRLLVRSRIYMYCITDIVPCQVAYSILCVICIETVGGSAGGGITCINEGNFDRSVQLAARSLLAAQDEPATGQAEVERE